MNVQTHTSSVAARTAARNAVTFDVEEWFHAGNLGIPRRSWNDFPSRLAEPADRILSLLDRHGTRATFFVLGWVAKRCPRLVQRIQAAGHEIASHGYWHRSVDAQTPREFHEDVRSSRSTLEDLTGVPVLGFRAPNYSLNPQASWALDVLEELGFAYDSSIYPARAPHARYGATGTPVRPYRIRPKLWEFPLPTLQLLRWRLPAATGGYLRASPLAVTQLALAQNLRHSIPVVVNVHPWELDPDHPRWPARWWKRALHYNNLHTTARKLDRLLATQRFGTLRELMVHCERATETRACQREAASNVDRLDESFTASRRCTVVSPVP
ncbi:MAG: XrtA system polysaccharide deacetylase [Phycisphaerae bacterium]